ncbi:hypothetical protein QVD17_35083 [Tagetes erecta]|uniref:Uncharacterized protein n=1 Tax=Tagetes erecta TaxID=13708 RepID=A0AAD8NM12_TARER|nr:hypothetical protein QVD17_35083 [Tagetes erecta]
MSDSVRHRSEQDSLCEKERFASVFRSCYLRSHYNFFHLYTLLWISVKICLSTFFVDLFTKFFNFTVWPSSNRF